MKKRLDFNSVIYIAIVIVVTIVTSSCNSCNNNVDDALKKVVIFHYDHVANMDRINFTRPVQIDKFYPTNLMTPFQEGGFWAIFVICSMDVEGREIQKFNYNISNFFVEYEGKNYGIALQPYTVNIGGRPNNNENTPQVNAAIVSQLQGGPSTQYFPHGFYPSLNYRIAILIPHRLQAYRGEQLTLRYSGQPSIVSIVVGGGNAPNPILAGHGFHEFEQPSSGCRRPLE